MGPELFRTRGQPWEIDRPGKPAYYGPLVPPGEAPAKKDERIALRAGKFGIGQKNGFLLGSKFAITSCSDGETCSVLPDFKVSRCSRRCYALERPLRPGEVFYSVVIEAEDGQLKRRDYSAEAWKEPPEGALGWWKAKMPEAGQRKLVLAPDPVLIDLLGQLAADPERAELAYLLSLLLLRRRVVRPVEETATEEGTAPLGKMLLETTADQRQIEITECSIRPADAAKLRDELHELLYCEAE